MPSPPNVFRARTVCETVRDGSINFVAVNLSQKTIG